MSIEGTTDREVHLIVERVSVLFTLFNERAMCSLAFTLYSHADLRTGDAVNYINDMVKRYSIELSFRNTFQLSVNQVLRLFCKKRLKTVFLLNNLSLYIELQDFLENHNL